MTSIVHLRLQPDSLPITNVREWETSGKQILVVSPGQKSQMTLHLYNPISEALTVELDVRGNFPSNWCRWNLEGRELRPQETMLIGINFDIPQDWLENQPLDTISLDYQATISIRLQDCAGLIRDSQKSSFNLYLRPDSLYLNFLPEIYREVDFIGRILNIFERAFEPTVNALELVWAYLDPLTAPESLLPFLSHWVGWEILSTISLERQRHLIRNAVSIYRWRGTIKGLRFYLHLYTGLPLDDDLPEREKHICIEEAIGAGFVLGQAHLGDSTMLGGGRPYHFTVRLRSTINHPLNETLIEKIIDAEKPTWCTYELFLEESVD